MITCSESAMTTRGANAITEILTITRLTVALRSTQLCTFFWRQYRWIYNVEGLHQPALFK